MADFVWELGIDWKAIVEKERSYLQAAFVRGTDTSERQLSLPIGLAIGDTITFRAFDVTAPQEPGLEIFGLRISSRAAVTGQTARNALQTDRPAVSMHVVPITSVAFRGSFRCWESEAVAIVQQGKFLVTLVLTTTLDGSLERIFVVDPEMVVGPDAVPEICPSGDDADGRPKS